MPRTPVIGKITLQQLWGNLSPFFLRFNSDLTLCGAESAWERRDAEDSILGVRGRPRATSRCERLDPAPDTPVQALGSPLVAPGPGLPSPVAATETGASCETTLPPSGRGYHHCAEADDLFPVSRPETEIRGDWGTFAKTHDCFRTANH